MPYIPLLALRCFDLVWYHTTICIKAPNVENETLEEIEAGLDLTFVHEGWLDPPAPPKGKLKLSLDKNIMASTSELPVPKANRFAEKRWCHRTQRKTTLGLREHSMLGYRSETTLSPQICCSVMIPAL